MSKSYILAIQSLNLSGWSVNSLMYVLSLLAIYLVWLVYTGGQRLGLMIEPDDLNVKHFLVYQRISHYMCKILDLFTQCTHDDHDGINTSVVFVTIGFANGLAID